MKKRLTTEEDYRRRVNLVVEYVRDHLDCEIDINTLAELSAFSPFHLHRILKGYLGESIGSFIIRTRVETAATLLRYSNMPVCDIAYRVGYGTPSSLTKAFVKLMKISPTEYRTTKNYQIIINHNVRKLTYQRVNLLSSSLKSFCTYVQMASIATSILVLTSPSFGKRLNARDYSLLASNTLGYTTTIRKLLWNKT